MSSKKNKKAEKLDKESEEGNIEYKLKLIDPNATRFEHLVTQMKFRLQEGMGEAIYEIGIEDNGYPKGLSVKELKLSIETLKKMALELNADITVLREREGEIGTVAEVLIRKFAEEDFLEIRIAVVGNVDSGKSTLVGVLTQGKLDNGRGLARVNVFRHKHEIETGRTSSISQQIMGYDSRGRIVNYESLNEKSWTKIIEGSSKVLTFIDLGGHEKYLKTTLFGLTGHKPDYVLLVVGANMGVVGMTKEHLGIALALKVPIIIVITKIDICPKHILKQTLDNLSKMLKIPGSNKIPIVVRNDDDIVVSAKNLASGRIAPIFLASNVTGENLDNLKKFLNLLPAHKMWDEFLDEPVEFQIDDTFSVTGVGTVIAGTLMSGTVAIDDELLLGPDEFGNFQEIKVKSIHNKRIQVKRVVAGQTATFALRRIQRAAIRKGMVLLGKDAKIKAAKEFEAEILVLYHSTTILENYQAVIHCGTIRQTAKITEMDKEVIRTGDKAKVRFRFLYNPEYLKKDRQIIFREGRTKGIGKITEIFYE
ncbi:MAG: elongation factor 1-alpha [Candidatus Heimdallarchaeota archaeon]|nr:elongation factor 1-alpha [Candidatus Heimdallarchaeota archaeon]MBY8994265.1 elongation factor 1-alpha [Candidatus Heimdallarchaeota archaeon]